MRGCQSVYLAGPIAGKSELEAKAWRAILAASLKDHGIIGVSPVRCEPPNAQGRYDLAPYNCDLFGSSRAIAAKNFFDVQNCDLALFFLPAPARGERQSYGTLIEFGWATAMGKPTIVVSDDPAVRGHPLMSRAGWLLDDLGDAEQVIIGVLGGYTHGGKNV